jgi:hypothetical protein
LTFAVELKLIRTVEYLLSPDLDVSDLNLKEKLGISKEIVK